MQLRAAGLQPFIAGYDVCGNPIVIVAPFSRNGGRIPIPVVPRPHGDTTVFPKSHFPQGFPKRPPVTADAAPVGIFPYTERARLPQAGDVTITAPKGRRVEPREILDQYRPQPGVSTVPERGRIPVERANSPEAATMGTRPIFRSDPIVSAPPQPLHVPERVSQPAPVVHERPVMQPAPPPRAEAPSPKEPSTPAPPSSR